MSPERSSGSENSGTSICTDGRSVTKSTGYVNYSYLTTRLLGWDPTSRVLSNTDYVFRILSDCCLAKPDWLLYSGAKSMPKISSAAKFGAIHWPCVQADATLTGEVCNDFAFIRYMMPF